MVMREYEKGRTREHRFPKSAGYLLIAVLWILAGLTGLNRAPFAAAAESKAETPYLYYTGNTWSEPGEIALVHGYRLDLITSVEILRLDDTGAETEPGYIVRTSYESLPTEEEIANASEPEWNAAKAQELAILQQTENSVKFLIPDTLQDGVFAVRLNYARGALFYYLNAPDVRWVQGDEGSIATPGGWLRVQGSCLTVDEKNSDIRAALLPVNGGELIRLTPDTVYDTHSVKFRIPESVPMGEYQVLYYNGCGSQTAWSTPHFITIGVSPRESWPTDVFNILDYGAVNDGTQRCNAAMVNALADIEKNGGGVLYFPAGRYLFTSGQFDIPENTVVTGESMEATLLMWSPLDWDIGEMPKYIFAGRRNLAFENLTFAGARVVEFMQLGEEDPSLALDAALGITDSEPFANIYIRNCRINFNNKNGIDTSKEGVTEALNSEISSGANDTTVGIVGENVQIVDSEILSGTGRYMVVQLTNSLVQNIRVTSSWNGFYGENTIFEDCGMGNTTLGTAGNNLYIARISIIDHLGNNRETMTTDGGNGRYRGQIEVADDGVTVTLTSEAGFGSQAGKGLGAVLYIISGTGEGQYRRIIEYPESNVVILEEPFYIEPDETSLIQLGLEERNSVYFIDWTVYNSGDVQFYGFQTNSVIEGFDVQRAAGMWMRGGNLYDAVQVDWYNSIENNSFTDSNYFKNHGMGDTQNRYTLVQIQANGNYGTINLGSMIRNNTLLDGAYMAISATSGKESIQNLVIQGNSFEGAVGAALGLGAGSKAVDGVLLRNNSFENVAAEYSYNSQALTEKNELGFLRILFCDEEGNSVMPSASYSSPGEAVYDDYQELAVGELLYEWEFEHSTNPLGFGTLTEEGTVRYQGDTFVPVQAEEELLTDSYVSIAFRSDEEKLSGQKNQLYLITRYLENGIYGDAVNVTLTSNAGYYATIEDGRTLCLQRVTLGHSNGLKTLCSVALSESVWDNEWHTLAIGAVGEQLNVWLDGELLIEYIDHTGAACRIGTAAVAVTQGVIEVDHLLVAELSAKEE